MNIPLTAILVVIIHGYPWCNHGALWHPLQRQVPVMTYTQPGMGITTIEAGKWPSWKDLQNIDMKWHFPVTIVDSIQYITSLRAWILQIYEVDSHQAARQRKFDCDMGGSCACWQAVLRCNAPPSCGRPVSCYAVLAFVIQNLVRWLILFLTHDWFILVQSCSEHYGITRQSAGPWSVIMGCGHNHWGSRTISDLQIYFL